MHLLRYAVKYTGTDMPFNSQANCSKFPPSAWINFLIWVTREIVTVRSSAALLPFLAALRIQQEEDSFHQQIGHKVKE